MDEKLKSGLGEAGRYAKGADWWPIPTGPGPMVQPIDSMTTATEAVLYRRLAAVMCMHRCDGETGWCVVCGEVEGWPCRTRAVANGMVWNRPVTKPLATPA